MMVPIIFVMARQFGSAAVENRDSGAGRDDHAACPDAPAPGPLIAVSALHADLGLTMLLGFSIAMPAVILAGPLYGNWLSKRMHIDEPAELGALFSRQIQSAAPTEFRHVAADHSVAGAADARQHPGESRDGARKAASP
jgi:GntP family gluconate:H+ symporter